MEIKIIDNFLDENDLKKLCSLKLNKTGKEEIKVYHNEIDKDNKILKNYFDKDFLITLKRNYHDKAYGLLKELSPKKAELYDYSDFTIIETGSNYIFPIHDDTPNKLLSGVVYLYPEKNTGTIFYSNKKGNNKKVIDWKPNRAVFFSRIEGEGWHSYEGDGISNRIALVYNLMTRRIKDVYKAEGKNYFLGNLRYKINPYLHQYFNFTI